jgi:hypothetical protein
MAEIHVSASLTIPVFLPLSDSQSQHHISLTVPLSCARGREYERKRVQVLEQGWRQSVIRRRGREGKDGTERKREHAIGRGEKRKEKGKKRERRVSQGREERK